MERIPGWHGKPVQPSSSRRSSPLALAVAVVSLALVIVGVVVLVVTGARHLLGIAMLVAVVALPAAASLHRRQR